MAEQNGTWFIWKVFWILLFVTAVEVILGIIKPPFLIENSMLGTSLLNFCKDSILHLVFGTHI